MFLEAQGLPSTTIEQLLENHTPTQVRLGFRKLTGMGPSHVARRILAGRFGFRKGFKQAIKQAAQPPQPPAPTSPPEEEPAWQQARQEALRRLAERNQA